MFKIVDEGFSGFLPELISSFPLQIQDDKIFLW